VRPTHRSLLEGEYSSTGYVPPADASVTIVTDSCGEFP
jgi:hypothetical protein